MVSCLFGRSRLSPGLPDLHCTSTFRGRQSQPQSFIGVNPSPLPGVGLPKLEPQHPALTLCGGCPNNFSAGRCQLALISVPNSLCFVFCVLVAALPSEVPKLPLSPSVGGVSKCVKTCPPSQLTPHGTGPVPFSLYLYFHALFLPLYVKFSFPFWKSEVFC